MGGMLFLLAAMISWGSAAAQAGGSLAAGGTVLIPIAGVPFPPLYWEVPLSTAPSWTTLIATPTYSGVPIVATFSAPDPDPNDYLVSISWGDGSPTAPGSVLPDGDGGFWALGATTYSVEGTYPVSVVITDSDGGSASAQSTAFVLNDVLEVTGTIVSPVEGAAFAGVVASFTGPSPRPSSYTVSIDWGDGSTTDGRVARGAAPGFDAIGDHTYSRAGTFTIGITVRDLGENTTAPETSVGSSSAIVSDAMLTGGDGGVFQAFKDAPYTGVVALFTDADPYGTWGDYAAVIDWGDGDGGALAADAIAPVDGGFAVIGTHTYHQLGDLAVGVAIVDGAGSSTFVSSTALVMPSPDAGPLSDAGLADGGLIWFSDDGGTLLFGDGGSGGTTGGCGCQPRPASPSGSALLLGAVLLLMTRAASRVRRW